MSEPAGNSTQPPRPSGRRIALQVAGFVLGCALVAWCVVRASSAGEGGLEKLRAAEPIHVWTLVLSTLGSIVCSGFTFWTVGLPVRRFGFGEMQAVNLMASLFNYAPVRLGLFLRALYHWRIDRMPVTDIGAWIAGVAIVTLGTLGAGLVAGLVQIVAGRKELAIDWMWFAGFGAVIVVGCAATRAVGRSAPLRRFLKGGERVLVDPRALYGGVAFRTVDLVMWSLRMWAAAKIVGVSLGPAQTAMLASVAILGAGNPLGRIGWREALVAFVAPYVLTADAPAEDIDALTAQLALLESAGEAILTIPLGIAGAAWCLLKVRRVRSGKASARPTP
ncbi:MAG: hypothetical protein LW636_12595 [Planctomycetaceae bacterium]|nr:hypothetical protein [Planctomycetaceae bacterium]